MDRRSPLTDEDYARAKRLEALYLSHADPLNQSGFSGGPEKWKQKRSIVLDAVDRDGSFLDVGCANGYLLECLVGWALERGLRLSPYGIDIGARLIALARRRLPEWHDRFFVGDIWTWPPPRRFDYVSTSLTGDAARKRAMLKWLMTELVEPGGRLILRCYFRQGHHGEFDGEYVDNEPFIRSEGMTPAGRVTSDPPGAEYVWIDR